MLKNEEKKGTQTQRANRGDMIIQTTQNNIQKILNKFP